MDNSSRKIWVDVLKGIAIVSVIWGHIFLGFIENQTFEDIQDVLTYVKNWIYTWHMPLFMFISGYTFKIAYIKDYKPDTKKVKFQRYNLTIIYFIFQTALCFLKILFSGFVDNKLDIQEALLNILYPQTLMWYLWVLVIYYISTTIYFNYMQNSWIIASIFIIAAILGRVLDKKYGLGVCFKGLTYCLPFFYTGIFFEKIRKYMFKSGFIISSFLYLVLFLTMISPSKNLPYIIYVIFEIINAFALITILCFLFDCKGLKLFQKPLSYLGKNSLIIYLLHTYIVTACKAFIIRVGIELGYISIIGVFIITIVICILAIQIIHQNYFISFLFYPLKNKAKYIT